MEGLEPQQGLILTPPTRPELMAFLEDIKGCRGQAKLCSNFYTDLRILLRELFHLRRDSTDKPFISRLYKEIRTVKNEIRVNSKTI